MKWCTGKEVTGAVMELLGYGEDEIQMVEFDVGAERPVVAF